MIADAHVDILLELAHREHRLGESGVFARTWLPLLEAGGVGLQVCPVFVDLEWQPEGSLREALRQVTALRHAVSESPDRVFQVRSRSDLDELGKGRIGLMPPGLSVGATLAGLSGPEHYPALVEALRRRGWDDERLDGLLAGNLLRFLRESLPAEDEAATNDDSVSS